MRSASPPQLVSLVQVEVPAHRRRLRGPRGGAARAAGARPGCGSVRGRRRAAPGGYSHGGTGRRCRAGCGGHRIVRISACAGPAGDAAGPAQRDHSRPSGRSWCSPARPALEHARTSSVLGSIRRCALHPAGGPQRLAVRLHEDGVGAAADRDLALDLARLGVDHREGIGAHDADDEPPAMPDDAGGFAADRDLPQHLPRLEIDGADRAAALQRDRDGLAVRAEGEVGGLLAAQPAEQRQGAAVIDVHLVAAQAGDDEVPAVRREFEMVGVRDALAPPHLAGGGIDEEDLVAAESAIIESCRPQRASGAPPQGGDAADLLMVAGRSARWSHRPNSAHNQVGAAAAEQEGEGNRQAARQRMARDGWRGGGRVRGRGTLRCRAEGRKRGVRRGPGGSAWDDAGQRGLLPSRPGAGMPSAHGRTVLRQPALPRVGDPCGTSHLRRDHGRNSRPGVAANSLISDSAARTDLGDHS